MRAVTSTNARREIHSDATDRANSASPTVQVGCTRMLPAPPAPAPAAAAAPSARLQADSDDDEVEVALLHPLARDDVGAGDERAVSPDGRPVATKVPVDSMDHEATGGALGPSSPGSKWKAADAIGMGSDRRDAGGAGASSAAATATAATAAAGWGERLRRSFDPRLNIRHLLCPTAQEGQLSVLDGIRGFAMTWVIVVHSWNMLTWKYAEDPTFIEISDSVWMRFIRAGELSVDMFFVLSGFLIAHIMIREHEKTGRVDVRNFFIRRALRIVPAYFIMLAFYWPIFTALGCENCGGCNKWGWSNLLFVNNFVPMFGSCMAWTWSIAVEVQFYLFSPLLLYVFNRSNRWGFIATLVLLGVSLPVRLGIIWGYGLYLPTVDYGFFMDTCYIKPYTRVGPYLIGLLLAMLWARYRALGRHFTPSRRLSVLLFAGFWLAVAIQAILILLGAGFPHSDGAWLVYMWLHRHVWALCTAFLIFCVLAASALESGFRSFWGRPLFTYPALVYRWFFSLRVWYIYAQISYSMYLIHPVWITAFFYKYAIDNPPSYGWFLVYCVVNISVSTAMALFMWLFIERPFMVLRDTAS